MEQKIDNKGYIDTIYIKGTTPDGRTKTYTIKMNPYSEIDSKPVPVEKFGKYPICNSPNSKIVWGWEEVYYDLICEKGHFWTYKFKKRGKIKEK